MPQDAWLLPLWFIFVTPAICLDFHLEANDNPRFTDGETSRGCVRPIPVSDQSPYSFSVGFRMEMALGHGNCILSCTVLCFLVPTTCDFLLAVGSSRGIFSVAYHPGSLGMVQESIFECRWSLPMTLSIFQGA